MITCCGYRCHKASVGRVNIHILDTYIHEYLLRGYRQYTYIKFYKNNRYLQYLLEYVQHSSGYNNYVKL